MLTFPEILIGIFTGAALLLGAILLAALLPRRADAESPDSREPLRHVSGRNGEGSTP